MNDEILADKPMKSRVRKKGSSPTKLKPSKRGLPRHLHLKSGTYYYVRFNPKTGKTKWTKLSRNLNDALVQYAALENAPAHDTYSFAAAALLPMTGKEIEDRKKTLLHSTRVNARTRGRDYCLTPSCITALFDRAGGRCELTGIPFSVKKIGDYRRPPFAPSLDRIDGSLGYSLDNCRLVCTAINLAMNERGEDLLQTIVLAYAARLKAQAG
jgi:hypothetical protein